MHIYPCEITFKDTLRLLYLAQITDLYFVDVEEFTHSIAHANVIVSPNMDVFLKKVQTAFDPPSSPFLEISLRFFRENAEICVNLQ